MRFSALAAYLGKLEVITSRNEITRVLAELFREIGTDEINTAVYLILGELVPAYRGIEFNIAEKMMVEILARAYARSPAEALRLYQAKGDQGDVAYDLASKTRARRGDGPSVRTVYERLLAIARESGAGSQERRISGFAALLRDLDPRSAKFVARIPVGKLRLGFSDATVLDALSLFAAGDKSARKRIEAAYNITADIGALARRLKLGGLSSLSNLEAAPGIPIRPSLAERLDSVEDVIVKVGPEVAVEPKLDGFRVQIHIWRERGLKRVALFSRNLENTTAMFPEIADAAKRLRVQSVILDGEAIGFNQTTGRYAPFQETAQRKRKHDIEAFVKKIPLVALVFDILYLNGTSLLNLPSAERRKILERLLGPPAARLPVGQGRAGRAPRGGILRVDPQVITDDPAVIARELRANVGKGLEGLVVKNLRSPYRAGSRGFHWIKLKANTSALQRLRSGPRTKDAGTGAGGHGRKTKPGSESRSLLPGKLPDTIDALVMGVYRGKGKRTAFGIGGFLLGVRGADSRYYSISRLGSGLSDAELREAKGRVEKIRTDEEPKEYVVRKEVAPDFWVRPEIVVEILADEISRSSRHTAGSPRSRFGGAGAKAGGPPAARRPDGRGYSLRFPRLVRFRDDKDPEDATTVAEIARMRNIQAKRGSR